MLPHLWHLGVPRRYSLASTCTSSEVVSVCSRCCSGARVHAVQCCSGACSPVPNTQSNRQLLLLLNKASVHEASTHQWVVYEYSLIVEDVVGDAGAQVRCWVLANTPEPPAVVLDLLQVLGQRSRQHARLQVDQGFTRQLLARFGGVWRAEDVPDYLLCPILPDRRPPAAAGAAIAWGCRERFVELRRIYSDAPGRSDRSCTSTVAVA